MDIGTINVVIDGGLEYAFPPLIPIDQKFARKRIESIADAVAMEMKKVPDKARNHQFCFLLSGIGILHLPYKSHNLLILKG